MKSPSKTPMCSTTKLSQTPVKHLKVLGKWYMGNKVKYEMFLLPPPHLFLFLSQMYMFKEMRGGGGINEVNKSIY